MSNGNLSTEQLDRHVLRQERERLINRIESEINPEFEPTGLMAFLVRCLMHVFASLEAIDRRQDALDKRLGEIGVQAHDAWLSTARF